MRNRTPIRKLLRWYLVTLPETTRDVGELLSLAHADEKAANRQCLVTIAENFTIFGQARYSFAWG